MKAVKVKRVGSRPESSNPITGAIAELGHQSGLGEKGMKKMAHVFTVLENVTGKCVN